MLSEKEREAIQNFEKNKSNTAQNCQFFGDYHTHTVASDGKSTLFENVASALSRGLKQLAITDHGFANPKRVALTPQKFCAQKAQIEELQAACGARLHLLHGIEADLIGTDGTIDLTGSQLKEVDILLLGYHSFPKAVNFAALYQIFALTYLGFVFAPTKATIARNTKILIRAVQKYPVDILSHLNHLFRVDCKEVAKACADSGTYVELNEKHGTFTHEEFEAMRSTGVKFIAGSDAHCAENIGVFPQIEAFLAEHGVGCEILENYQKCAEFPRRMARQK